LIVPSLAADSPLPAGRFLAPPHTHDATGIVHIESDRPYPFTLGQFFKIWGVRFGATRIGGYADLGAQRVWVLVNGRRVADSADHVLRAHDRIVVGFGRRGSFPAVDRTPSHRGCERPGRLARGRGPYARPLRLTFEAPPMPGGAS
jgi:hypothetical protein